MNLSPDQSQAAVAYYAWKCAQIEAMLGHKNEQIDKLASELNRMQAIDARAPKTAPRPMDAEYREVEPMAVAAHDTEGGSVD